MSDLKLNLGAGGCPIKGRDWINVDAGYEPGTAASDPQPDGCRRVKDQIYPLTAFEDETVSEVRCSHTLEHFPHRQTMDVLREWVRVLKPGGILKIAVPDFAKIAAEYQSGVSEWPIQSYLMGGQTDERDFHHAIFDEVGLREALESLGLVDIQHWTSEVQDCASLPVSLNLQGRKPGGECPECFSDEKPCECLGGPCGCDRCKAWRTKQKAVEAPTPSTEVHIPPGAVKAVLSLPRLAFTDTLFCAIKALTPLGIQLERTGGAFWNQGMETLLDRHLHDDTQYVLTLDYDSLFTREDVMELVRLLVTRPEIDAVCALQMRREEDSPLMCVGAEFEGTLPKTVEIPVATLRQETMPVRTGHFGLTLFRVESLRKLPKPWLHAVPDADGGWGTGRMDADIAFWDRWGKAGLSLHVANRVVIGHLELMASWPDEMLRKRHQPVSEYNETGKPGWAWR